MSESKVKFTMQEWLSSQSFEEILREYYKNDAMKVINFDLKSTSANEEGFTSSMHRAKINLSASSETEVFK